MRLITLRNRHLMSLQIENKENENAESKELILLSFKNDNLKLNEVKN